MNVAKPPAPKENSDNDFKKPENIFERMKKQANNVPEGPNEKPKVLQSSLFDKPKEKAEVKINVAPQAIVSDLKPKAGPESLFGNIKKVTPTIGEKKSSLFDAQDAPKDK